MTNAFGVEHVSKRTHKSESGKNPYKNTKESIIARSAAAKGVLKEKERFKDVDPKEAAQLLHEKKLGVQNKNYDPVGVALDNWQNDSRGVKRSAKKKITKPRIAIDNLHSRDTAVHRMYQRSLAPSGKLIGEMIEHSPVTDKSLYRGISTKKHEIKPGDEIKGGLSSWSASGKKSLDFADGAFGHNNKNNKNRYRLELEPGTKAISVNNHNGIKRFREEKEYITNSDFKVDGQKNPITTRGKDINRLVVKDQYNRDELGRFAISKSAFGVIH